MNNITVIIPIHSISSEEMNLLHKAINSVPKDIPIILSCGKNVNSQKITEDTDHSITSINEANGTTFAELTNAAVKAVTTDYFSILEFDDEYTPYWFTHVQAYIEEYPQNSVFMPLTDILDFSDSHFINFGNAEAWASSFSNDIGYIDNECLQNYFDFYLTGSVFKTEDWNEVGGLKPLIKVTFWYEWLLRATNQDKKVYVIPKIGYKHYLGRPSSLIEQYKATVSQDEAQWWFDLAKKDSYHKTEKDAEYYVYQKNDEQRQ